MALYVAMSAAALGINLCEPYLIGSMLNALQSATPGGNLLRTIAWYLAGYVSIQVGFWSLHGPSRVIERGVAFHVRSHYQMYLFNIVTALPVQWHKDHHSGETIDKINRAVTSLFDFCDRSFEIIHMVSRYCGALIILFFFMRPAALMAMGATSLAVLTTMLFDRALIGHYKELNRRFNHTAAAVHDYVSNIITVLSLRLEGNVAGEVLARLSSAVTVFRRNVVLNELKWFVTTMMVVGVIAGILYWYAASTMHAGGVLLVGTFFTLFEYLRRIGDTFYGFALRYGTIVQQSANVRGTDTITGAFDESLGRAAQARLPDDWRRVDISGLTYAYEDDKRRVHHLNDVSLRIERGKFIALVGESGSGKSTLLSILRGLRTPLAARVMCDGRELSPAHVAHHVTLIPQDPEIFADTIRFNVTMGLASDEAEILDAIGQARFRPVLDRLPNRLDTNIAEKGVNLSGGEKQRLALSRGIFFARQSEIILLDEPTSSVDFANERIIYENMRRLFGDRCLISSIHRLHLLTLFDEVIVLDAGRIIERGTFAELLRRGGRLAELWRSHQMDRAEDGSPLVVTAPAASPTPDAVEITPAVGPITPTLQ